MPRAGRTASSSARAMVMSPLSIGSRSASMTSVRNSGNSSRKSTPQCARLISPGRTWPLPPPTRAALLASWCGAAYGGRVISPSPGSRAPASECSAVSSTASSRVRSGRSPGIRSARLVLPEPLGPESSRWCPPAAAHLGGVARVGHPVQVAQVDLVEPLPPAPGQQPAARHRGDRRRLGHLVAAELGHHLGERPHPDDLDAPGHDRLAHLRLGHEDPGDAALRGRRAPSAARPARSAGRRTASARR